MAEILKVFTPEQMVELIKNHVLASGVGLTNWNVGGRLRTLAEAIALLESTTGQDYVDALRLAIPVSLYDGLGFTRKGATKSSGYFRLFRLPEFTLRYDGAGTDCLLTISGTALTTACTGAPGDNLNLAFVTYTTIADLVTAINLAGNYTAVLVSGGTGLTTSLYNYGAEDITLKTNYLDGVGQDIVLASAGLIPILSGSTITVNDQTYITTAISQIDAGEATSGDIAAEAVVAGASGDMLANAVDTLNGKGFMNTAITGVEYAINDSAFSGGVDEESDDERAERFSIYVQGLSGGTARAIQAAVLAIEGIKSVTVLENEPQRGYITVVADNGTGTLTAALITEIQKVLEGDPDDLENYPGERPAGVTANVEAPTVTDVDVTLSVTRIGTLSDSTEIETAVQSAIENYINTLKLGGDVVLNQIRAIAMASHPAIYDCAVSLPVANVSVPDSNVARTGSGTGGTVTVSIITLSVAP